MEFPEEVIRLMGLLEAAGHETWAVGGCVRDRLLGREPHDWDLCTAAKPEEMEAVFKEFRVLRTGIRHGTLGVLLEERAYEITTFRQEGAYRDHRRPERVRYVTALEEDLARRDFTINAMAAHPVRGLCDPFGGARDLEAGVIRCVGRPAARFEEDALRILRGIRFAARFGFRVEEATAAAMGKKSGLLAVLSAERVYGELTGLLTAEAPGAVMGQFAGILALAAPEGDWAWGAGAIDRGPREAAARWSMIFRDGEAARRGLERLKADGRTLEAAQALAGEGERPRAEAVWMRRALARLGPERLRLRLGIAAARGEGEAGCEAALEAVLARGDAYRVGMLAVSGADLIFSGACEAGPACGRCLRQLLEAVMAGKVENDRDALLARLRGNCGSPSTVASLPAPPRGKGRG